MTAPIQTWSTVWAEAASPCTPGWKATTPPFFVVTGSPLLVDCHCRQLAQRNVRSSPTSTHLTYALHTGCCVAWDAA